MNSKVIFAFVAGAAVGVGASWQYFKKKYETLAREEIESVKELFSYKKEAVSYDFSADLEEGVSINTSQQPRRLKEENYFDYSAISKKPDEKKKEDDCPGPYVIPPENFGEYENYERISLTYYSDNILVDDDDRPVEDVEGTVGVESLSHFGEFEDDSVHVRNERLHCDFEILLDPAPYSDIVKSKPYIMDD